VHLLKVLEMYSTRIIIDFLEGWSEARISAYAQLESNPNSYYFRFNKPGMNYKSPQWINVR
jgi:hypothetical protein